jgi:hypothetical protein
MRETKKGRAVSMSVAVAKLRGSLKLLLRSQSSHSNYLRGIEGGDQATGMRRGRWSLRGEFAGVAMAIVGVAARDIRLLINLSVWYLLTTCVTSWELI